MYHSESNQYRDSKWRKLLVKYIYDRLVRHIKREIGNRKAGLQQCIGAFQHNYLGLQGGGGHLSTPAHKSSH